MSACIIALSHLQVLFPNSCRCSPRLLANFVWRPSPRQVLGRPARGNVFQIFRGGQSNWRANDGAHSRRTFYFLCHRHHSRGHAYALGNMDNHHWNFRGFATVLHLLFRSVDVAFAAPRSEAAFLTTRVAGHTRILPIMKFSNVMRRKKLKFNF